MLQLRDWIVVLVVLVLDVVIVLLDYLLEPGLG